MSSPKPATTPIGDILNRSQKMLGTIPVMGPQAAHFWEAQDNILSDTETFARQWFERRHTATRTALEAAMDISANGSSDPAYALKSVADWQTHSMERIAEDFRDWLDLCSRCADHFGQAEMNAGQDSLQEITKSTTSTKRKKDDVPV